MTTVAANDPRFLGLMQALVDEKRLRILEALRPGRWIHPTFPTSPVK